MTEWPETEQKVAFLQRPDAYPGAVQRVETIRTHMSWVFLTEHDAWKLKRPAKSAFLDFSTPEKRRQNCLREVRLNRRLAPDVYLGVVPLTLEAGGRLALDGDGIAVDWLVRMRRLERWRMLDRMVQSGAVTADHVTAVSARLTGFYANAEPVRITPAEYRHRLAQQLESVRRELGDPVFRLPTGLVESVVPPQIRFLAENAGLFDERAEADRIVDAHGDLRPEHICLEDPPVIIDCLEFNRDLRLLDPHSELAFLALECDRLGASWIGRDIAAFYSRHRPDPAPPALVEFYKGFHASIRATIALRHLRDGDERRDAWIRKGIAYLRLAGGAPRAA